MRVVRLITFNKDCIVHSFATSACHHWPRGPNQDSSQKWRDFLKDNQKGDNQEIIAETNFGNIRLDSMNKTDKTAASTAITTTFNSKPLNNSTESNVG